MDKLRKGIRALIPYKGNLKIAFERWKLLQILNFSPNRLCYFIPGGLMPLPEERCRSCVDPLDEFKIIHGLSSSLKKERRVTVVIPGKSHVRCDIKNVTGPLLLVNWPVKIERHDVYYVTGDYGHLLRFARMGMFPIILIRTLVSGEQGFEVSAKPHGKHKEELEAVMNNPNCFQVVFSHDVKNPSSQLGSGLGSVIMAAWLADEVDVYGWDHYLSRSPIEMSYGKFLANFDNPRSAEVPGKSIACSIYNFHYAHRLKEHARIHNHGFTGETGKWSRRMNRLGDVLYRN